MIFRYRARTAKPQAFVTVPRRCAGVFWEAAVFGSFVWADQVFAATTSGEHSPLT
jgi:hypothetical protein